MKTTSKSALLCLSSALLVSCGGGTEPASRSNVLAAATMQGSAQAVHLASDYHNVIQHIYVAYFGRAADPAGRDYFAGLLLGANAPTDIVELSKAYDSNPVVRSMIDTFGNSQESKDLYPGSNAAFMDAVYMNLFGRAPDGPGKAYWVELIDSGKLTRAYAAVSVMAGALSTDVDVINTKSAVAANFTSSLNTVQGVGAYDGLAANVVVRNMLGTVTLGTNVPAFQPTINSTISKLFAEMPVTAIYTGLVKSSQIIHWLVLENNELWGYYNASDVGPALSPAGFVQGIGSLNGGVFTVSDMKDFNPNPAVAGTITADVVPNASLKGNIGVPGGSVPFTSTAIASATYNYNTAALIADLAPSWRMKGTTGTLYTLSVGPDGSFSGTGGGCNYTGSLSPRSSGKNIFNVNWTFGAGSCVLANQGSSGVAFSYLLNDGATRQLVISTTNSARTTGTVISGLTATPAGQPAALVKTDTVIGTGADAVAGKRITVHYTGWLYSANAANLRSTKFDSSVDRGPPFSFTLGAGAVIAGWDQGVAGMKVGGKRTLVIPASLGYGATGQGGIPPNAGMVFDVELISVP